MFYAQVLDDEFIPSVVVDVDEHGFDRCITFDENTYGDVNYP